MVAVDAHEPDWRERSTRRAGVERRSNARSIKTAEQIMNAALALVGEKGSAFTVQELAKEAGVSLQTFYRYFAGKEELILAVVEQLVTQACDERRAKAQDIADPVERLRSHVTDMIALLYQDINQEALRFVPSAHLRLQEVYPDELARVTRRFTDLLVPEIEAAVAAGRLTSTDIEQDAWFLTQLVVTTFHHYAFTSERPPAELADQLWGFCLGALGGTAPNPTASPEEPTPRSGLEAVSRRAVGVVRRTSDVLARQTRARGERRG